MLAKIFRSPSKYIQGNGILESGAASYIIEILGNRILVISGKRAFQSCGDLICQKLKEAGAEVELDWFCGQSSKDEVERITKLVKEKGYEAILAIGGGKIGDTARGVVADTGIRMGMIPTIAATDAPVASLYAIYDNTDTLLGCYFTKNPDIVVVDTKVICKAPARYLASGIADGLATWLEAKANSSHKGTTTAGGQATIAGLAIAEKCEEILFKYGIQAYEANKAQVVTPAFENVVEANILLSGIGYESGGLAAAHSIHDALTVLNGDIENVMHGEKVAFGILTQLFLEQHSCEELDKYISFLRRLGLPTTFRDLHIEGISDEDLLKVGKAAVSEGTPMQQMPFAVTAEMVADAMKAVDAYVNTYY